MRESTQKQKYYFSDKLQRQLEQLSQHPLTIIEAPSGFGKTTAVREYLRSRHPHAVCKWYTCLGDQAPVIWAEICELFASLNRKVADELKNLKLPTRDTLHYIKAALKDLKCQSETYLVIDNYQQIHWDLQRELIEAFSMHENPFLHLIVLTHQLESMRQLPLHQDRICMIDAAPFFFDRKGIASLLHMEGIRLAEEEQEDIFKRTEGWISAIRLQMLHYKETGSFAGSAGIERLVEAAIWNHRTPEEKEFLLAVSVFDRFTARQATYMLDYEILPGKIESTLKTSEFIRFLPDERQFIIHSILLQYLRNQFHYHQSKEFQNRILHKAGLSYAAIGEYCSAAKFFYQVGDLESLLSLPFTRQYMDSQKENCEDGLLMAIVQECPDEILLRHPTTMIVFAHFALLNGKYEIYQKLCGLLHTFDRERTELSEGEAKRIKGELILLETLGNFNDLSKMREGFETANELLGGAPEFIENCIPWFSVFPTTVGMLWRETGTMNELLHAVDLLKPIYRAFGRGQGAGLAELIRAEAMLLRGDDNEAEIFCHRALHQAHLNRQTSICIYAKLCLARIFILRGDTDNFLVVFKSIQEYTALREEPVTRRMADMCLSFISLLLGTKDYVASWLCDMESIRKSLHVPVIPFAQILHFRLLLIDKRYNELYALIPLALESLEHSYAHIQYRMPQLYCFIFLAVAKYNNGEILEAQRYLVEALNIAQPDGVYLPFVDHEQIFVLLSALSISCINEHRFTPYKENPPNPTMPFAGRSKGHLQSAPSGMVDSLAVLSALCKRQQDGISVIRKALLRNKSPLTPREREIALLAKERLSAKEIAEKLYISEATVKWTLACAYSKLEIHSRRELSSVEF